MSGSNRLMKPGKKRWAGVLLSGNAAVLCKNHVKESCKFEPARLKKKKKKKEKHFGHLATFWFGTFAMLFCATGYIVRHENTRR